MGNLPISSQINAPASSTPQSFPMQGIGVCDANAAEVTEIEGDCMLNQGIRAFAVLALSVGLAACSPDHSGSFKPQDAATVGRFLVKWSDYSNLSGKRSDGLTLLMFFILPNPTGGPYATPAARVQLAQAALAVSTTCTWAGFDPQLDAKFAAGNGGRESSLYALARCK